LLKSRARAKARRPRWSNRPAARGGFHHIPATQEQPFRGDTFYPFQKEDFIMYRVSGIFIMVAGLTLLLGAEPGWAGPPNPDSAALHKKAAQARFDQMRMAADSDDSKAHASSTFRFNR
jgi:hypothetical protein